MLGISVVDATPTARQIGQLFEPIHINWKSSWQLTMPWLELQSSTRFLTRLIVNKSRGPMGFLLDLYTFIGYMQRFAYMRL